jgi:hypothetical protein
VGGVSHGLSLGVNPGRLGDPTLIDPNRGVAVDPHRGEQQVEAQTDAHDREEPVSAVVSIP